MMPSKIMEKNEKIKIKNNNNGGAFSKNGMPTLIGQ
jgi:hypothetical protein